MLPISGWLFDMGAGVCKRVMVFGLACWMSCLLGEFFWLWELHTEAANWALQQPCATIKGIFRCTIKFFELHRVFDLSLPVSFWFSSLVVTKRMVSDAVLFLVKRWEFFFFFFFCWSRLRMSRSIDWLLFIIQILLKLDKSKEDKMAENNRNELLKFLNASYDWSHWDDGMQPIRTRSELIKPKSWVIWYLPKSFPERF